MLQLWSVEFYTNCGYFDTLKDISPGTKTLITTLVNRYDSEELHHKALRVNDKVKQLLPAYDLIENGNLDQS